MNNVLVLSGGIVKSCVVFTSVNHVDHEKDSDGRLGSIVFLTDVTARVWDSLNNTVKKKAKHFQKTKYVLSDPSGSCSQVGSRYISHCT